MRDKKTAALFLSLALACSVNITAFAADESPKTVDQIGGSAVANVTGTYKEGQSGAARYKVDIAWTDLSFTYTSGSEGTWDPDTHTYNGATEGGWAASQEPLPLPTIPMPGSRQRPLMRRKQVMRVPGWHLRGFPCSLAPLTTGTVRMAQGRRQEGP